MKQNEFDYNRIIQKLDEIDKVVDKIASRQQHVAENKKPPKQRGRNTLFILRGLGILFLFGSWIAQNSYLNNWQGRKAEFDFKFSTITGTQNIYLLHQASGKTFYALNKISPDTFIFRNALGHLSYYCQEYILFKRLLSTLLNEDKNTLADTAYANRYIGLTGDSLLVDRFFQNSRLDSMNMLANALIAQSELDSVNRDLNSVRNYYLKLQNNLSWWNNFLSFPISLEVFCLESRSSWRIYEKDE